MVLAAGGDAAGGPAEVRLADVEAAAHAAVELGLDEEAEDVGARAQHEAEPDGHHRRAEAPVVGLAVQAGARAVERHLLPHHGHRHRPPALPRLVELRHLHIRRSKRQCCAVHIDSTSIQNQELKKINSNLKAKAMMALGRCTPGGHHPVHHRILTGSSNGSLRKSGTSSQLTYSINPSLVAQVSPKSVKAVMSETKPRKAVKARPFWRSKAQHQGLHTATSPGPLPREQQGRGCVPVWQCGAEELLLHGPCMLRRWAAAKTIG